MGQVSDGDNMEQGNEVLQLTHILCPKMNLSYPFEIP